MPKKKSKPTESYALLTVKVDRFSVAVNATVNAIARETHWDNGRLNVFSFGSSLEIEGTCSYPEERAGDNVQVEISGSPPGEIDFDAKLGDVHARDERGTLMYRRQRGRDVPVYDIPNGLGLLHRERGTTNWHGWAWLPEQVITQMLILLTNVRPLFLEIHERTVGRKHWINGLTLQTTDPNEE